MIRSRFNELCAYLQAQAATLKFRPEQCDTEIEDFTVADGGHQQTVKGYWFANFRYRGVLYIERLPLASLPVLAVQVKAWLDENDDVRYDFKLPDPQIQAAELDDKTLDVVVTVEFIDPVYLAPAADGKGNVNWNGKSWTVAEYAVNVAEAGTVNDAQV